MAKLAKLTQQKWFLWLTRYWFLFPIAGFVLLEAGVFLYYGERSYIAVHDNMDLFLAQYQMLKNTGSFWKHGVDVPFLGGISRDNLPTELSLYSALYMIFPTFTAYVLGLLLKIAIAIFSFRLLIKELYPEKYSELRPIVYMTGFVYGILNVFPAYGFAFASMPLAAYLLIRIYRKPSKGLYAALFLYPLVSYFSYMGIFILGYLVIAILWLSIKDKKPAWRLVLALFVLVLGYVVCEYRLFGQMLFGSEETIRSTMVNASLSLPEIIREIGTVWKEGIFHADGVHTKVVLPVCMLYFIFNNACYIWKKQTHKIWHDAFNFCMLFLVFNSVVYGLYDCGPVRSLVETLLPPLKGFQFNRTVFFNPFLWYSALFLILKRLYEAGIWRTWLANLVICAAVLVVILTPTRYNDIYYTCYYRAYEFFHGTEVDELDYEQFYATELFEEIKEDIGYGGEWSAAYGMHPAILEYNDIATLDGYLGFYTQQYKEEFRKIIAPALERVEETRIYYDDWGARAYLYSGTDLSIVGAVKTLPVTDYNIYIDADSFRALGGKYIFSRLELENAEEAGLLLLNQYTSEDGSYTIYVYRS
ncbi:MAG: DUF6044 family protein [Blautia sp.]|nr:DUF6044 family protein [Lachnoclostridium sp.]MCM1211001.1 DUF6044 family protein [Blautia sp.]